MAKLTPLMMVTVWKVGCIIVTVLDHMKQGMSGMLTSLAQNHETDDLANQLVQTFTLSDEPGLWMKTL